MIKRYTSGRMGAHHRKSQFKADWRRPRNSVTEAVKTPGEMGAAAVRTASDPGGDVPRDPAWDC